MAKGSVRKKGKKWYYRFYVEDASGKLIQAFMDLLAFGGTEGDFHARSDYNRDYPKSYNSVLSKAFRYAVFPKRYITYNPMQYVVMKKQKADADLFVSDDEFDENTKPLTPEMYSELIDYLKKHHPDAILPVQISYYAGLRIGEAAGLTWQDINLEDHYLTVRRSVAYNPQRHMVEIGPTKRAKIRVVDFGDTLAKILKEAKKLRKQAEKEYGPLYHNCYYKEVREKNRTYYDYYTMDRTVEVPEGYHEIDFICRRSDGTLMRPSTIRTACKYVGENIPGFEGFHFHVLRHTYTTNLLKNGAQPKDVQELLGHSDVRTTMNIYAHASRESKRSSARLLDKIS